MHDQTIWIPPRATTFNEACEACEEELSDGRPWAPVSGSLDLGHGQGWATCPLGHEIRVLRMGPTMPAGALH
jgi:hypothetical protein